jgi:hypothetical protein
MDSKDRNEIWIINGDGIKKEYETKAATVKFGAFLDASL